MVFAVRPLSALSHFIASSQEIWSTIHYSQAKEKAIAITNIGHRIYTYMLYSIGEYVIIKVNSSYIARF